MNAPLSKAEIFASLPPVWPKDVKPRIREMLAARPHHKLVVLDDDPTGTQTVYDVPVLTTWDVEALTREFDSDGHCFYILTNSRSLVANDAKALNHEIATNLRNVADGRPFTVVSRSDSTLRGHFPLETDVLTEELGPFDATLIIPYFEAGGRYTIHDVHYVAEGDKLTPAAETPFAKDAVFGYSNSSLRDWVEEKTQGRVKAGDVASVSLETIRVGGPQAVCDALLGLANGATCIVNAAALADMDVFALGLLMAEKRERRFLQRSAAQIVAARLGLEARPLLTREDLMTDGAGGGLIIVGSYVPKTTGQLQRLLEEMERRRARRLTVGEDANNPCEGGDAVVPLSVPDLLDASRRSACLENALLTIHESLQANRDVVVFTSRELVTGGDAAKNLQIGNSVSGALVEIVQRITVRPRYLIAKGGITSSDVASQGLGLKRAIVAGQILPGVPTWRVGDETRFPGMAYIVFPGNVGGPSALADVIARLSSH